MEGNIRQHFSPPEACLGVSQPLTSPRLFPPLASYLSHIIYPGHILQDAMGIDTSFICM